MFLCINRVIEKRELSWALFFFLLTDFLPYSSCGLSHGLLTTITPVWLIFLFCSCWRCGTSLFDGHSNGIDINRKPGHNIWILTLTQLYPSFLTDVRHLSIDWEAAETLPPRLERPTVVVYKTSVLSQSHFFSANCDMPVSLFSCLQCLSYRATIYTRGCSGPFAVFKSYSNF